VATQHTLTFQYDQPPEKVLALILDPDFLAERSRAMGEIDVQVTARRDGDRVVVVNQRSVKRDLPSFAAKLFSPVNQVTQTEQWTTTGDTKRGSYKLEVKGAPVTMNAQLELRPQGSGTEYRVTYDITVKVPLIGGKLESYTLEQTKAGARKELEYTAERLRRG
jgi:hypothetical protein